MNEGMRWRTADELDRDGFRARILLLGSAKVGKTTVAVMSSPGKVGILLADADSALRQCKREQAKRRAKAEAAGREYTDHYMSVSIRGATYQGMMDAIGFAKRAAKRGEINTVVLDPLSEVSEQLLSECFATTKTSGGSEDGRKAYPLYTRRILILLKTLLACPCHVVVVNHYIPAKKPDPTTETKEQKQYREASGDDQLVVPMLATKEARALVPGIFDDILFMGYDAGRVGGSRYILTGPRGAITGPGARSLGSTVETSASIYGFVKLCTGETPMPEKTSMKLKGK